MRKSQKEDTPDSATTTTWGTRILLINLLTLPGTDSSLPTNATHDVKNVDPRTHKFVQTNFVQANKIIKLHQHGEIEHCRFDDDIC